MLVREAMNVEAITKKSTFKSSELAQRYEEALEDPELVALRRPLALTSARIQQLLERVEDGVTDELWVGAAQAFDGLKVAIKKGDDLEIGKYLSILDGIFKRVEDDYQSWRQVFEALELQRKLSESERKRLVEMKQFITAQDAMEMVRALTSSVFKIVQDPLMLRRIVYEFSRITGVITPTSDTGLGEEGGEGERD